MSPVERSLIERKLGQITERLPHIERYLSEGFPAYAAQFERRKAAEKILQEMIEAAIDINVHVLVALAATAPRDYHQSFTEMGKRGYLPVPLAERLAPAAGLRNRLVHQYATVDDQRVFDGLALAAEMFPIYVSHIRDLLD
jgi:uncharacterized protein YutE (UPF0331/DUF86 family)